MCWNRIHYCEIYDCTNFDVLQNINHIHPSGMAHLLEHVAYMGSPKRQLISGTGSRTNAYTDFHHTVFFAACPTEASW